MMSIPMTAVFSRGQLQRQGCYRLVARRIVLKFQLIRSDKLELSDRATGYLTRPLNR